MSIVSITHPPRTMMEVFKSLPEGTLVQLIENELVMSPSPLFVHQKVQIKISSALFLFVKDHQLGEVIYSPYDVHFDEENVLQPDILFINNENLYCIEEDGLHGAPDLVVEILSPSTARHDKGKKKDIYERFGVKEYWIIDPATKAAQGYSLQGNVFVEIGNEVGVIRSRLLGTEFSF